MTCLLSILCVFHTFQVMFKATKRDAVQAQVFPARSQSVAGAWKS